MTIVKESEELNKNNIKARIRLDYRGDLKSTKFFFSNKNTERAAEELREQKVNLLKNVPMQGITVEDIDLSTDVYTIFDEVTGAEAAFAPVQIIVDAISLEDLMQFVLKEEFRKIEIIEPQELDFGAKDVERLLYRTSSELNRLRINLERKYSK
ncbi:cystathionine beta-lyase family protein involved in aluminum resistance [Desulfitispora alkaliphila]|uniref:hypothetical protein n=1 Tax=Desulfitispora alkaliphila TaxID=622674 RepID=UPI003D23D684